MAFLGGFEYDGVLEFFIYDTVKILLLLFVMIFSIGVLRTFIPQSKVRAWLSGGRRGLGYVVAVLLGVLTPFCSCSSIPLFIGLVESGVPLGVTFSFLVVSPLVNEYLVVLMLGFFGLKITLLYVLSGMVLAVVSGLLASRLGLEKYLVKDVVGVITPEKRYDIFSERIDYGFHEAVSIVRKLWLWVAFGVGLGALIHGYVPEEAIHGLLERTGIFTVPLAVLLGVPIYANCVAIVPVAVVLFQKGVPLGTALAFMMASAALSLPEAVILRRVMRIQLILLFFGVVAFGIILTGYLFNVLQGLLF